MRITFKRPNGLIARVLLSTFIVALAIAQPVFSNTAHAANEPTDEGFALQVSPSPLVQTIKPGQTSTFDLQIRNTNSQQQNLKMGLRSFTVDGTTGAVQLGDKSPSDVAQFVTFSDPTFTTQAGQIFTQRVVVATPASAGFTYSFAITVSQQNPPKAVKGNTSIQGSVAVFTLLSVDRPGAVRKLELSQFAATKHAFEYLPASFDLKLKNSGNTLVQPSGTIYIQRHSDDKKPLAAIQLNKAGGFILPGSTRQLTTEWNDGFPHYISTTEDGKTSRRLSWAGGDFTKLRIGRYTAKLVAVYDDGQRDVPITSEVTFWVIPWRMLLILVVILAIILVGVATILRKSTKAIKRNTKGHAAQK
ncbi:hypothetical protein H7097_04430 [Aeromicrobium sp.]|nr:hypothetical protein [Candidatus Saccharibacteria bacterium]